MFRARRYYLRRKQYKQKRAGNFFGNFTYINHYNISTETLLNNIDLCCLFDRIWEYESGEADIVVEALQKSRNCLIFYEDYISDIFDENKELKEKATPLNKFIYQFPNNNFVISEHSADLDDKEYISFRDIITPIAVHNYVEHPESWPVRIKLGCDPELMILTRTTLTRLAAHQYFDEIEQEVDDEMDYYSCAIGMDGSSIELELRPCPSQFPIVLVQNIKHLINELDREFNYFCISWERPLGGHIHLSVIDARNKNQIMLYPNATAQLISLFDFFLKPIFEGDTINQATRNEWGYLSQVQWVRRSFCGGMEYRKPSALWLLKPKLAKIVFSLIKKITKYYFEHLFTKQAFSVDEHEMPTLESYAKIGALAEGRYILRFKPGYMAFRCIQANWDAAKKNNIFYDTNSITGHFRDVIKRMRSRYSIYIYGLKAARGNVVALRNNLKNCEILIPPKLMNEIKNISGLSHIQIDTPTNIQKKHAAITIGFSYKFRERVKEKLANDFRSTAARLLKLLKQLILEAI